MVGVHYHTLRRDQEDARVRVRGCDTSSFNAGHHSLVSPVVPIAPEKHDLVPKIRARSVDLSFFLKSNHRNGLPLRKRGAHTAICLHDENVALRLREFRQL